MALRLTWIAIGALQWTSLVLLLAGVVLFGWHLMRTVSNKRESQGGGLSPEIWRAAAARIALKIFGAGIGMQLLSVFLASVVPGRL